MMDSIETKKAASDAEVARLLVVLHSREAKVLPVCPKPLSG